MSCRNDLQETFFVAALHTSCCVVSSASTRHPNPVHALQLEHRRFLFCQQPIDPTTAARCSRWEIDTCHTCTSKARLRLLCMTGHAKILVRALAGRKGTVSATRELWEAKIHEEERHSIVTQLARRLTGVSGYHLLLRTSIRRLQPLPNAHVIVAMDVAGADDVVHGSGRSTSRVVEWFRRMSFGGHGRFVRFNDDDGSGSVSSGSGNRNRDGVQVSSSSSNRGNRDRDGVQANVNDGVFSGVRRMWSNFVDDFRCSRQLGSLYRLRALFPIMFFLQRCLNFLRRSVFTENCLFVSNLLLIIVLPFLFLIPVQHTNGHEGPSVIPGDCSSLHNRCHIASRCEMVSSYPNPTHTCSCPSWLIGSGFDDDPCICQRRFFPIPDFGRDSCVTQMSHLTLGFWVLFMYGMGTLVAVGIWLLFGGYPLSCFSVLFLGLALGFMIPVALQGFGQPEPVRLCGGELCSSWQQCIDNACVTQCPPVMRARGSECIAGGVGNCSSAATQALCDTSAMCVQLEEGAFACKCPDFLSENSVLDIRCIRNVSCAYERRMFMGSQGSPCQCLTNRPWNNKWIPDFERLQCVDMLLRLNWSDYITFNILVGIADILLIFYLCFFLDLVYYDEIYVEKLTSYIIFTSVITAYALFHGIAFGLGLNPVVPKVACGSSPLDFHLCPANQQCNQDTCV